MLHAEMPTMKQNLLCDVYLRALHCPLRPGILPREHGAGVGWIYGAALEACYTGNEDWARSPDSQWLYETKSLFLVI